MRFLYELLQIITSDEVGPYIRISTLFLPQFYLDIEPI